MAEFSSGWSSDRVRKIFNRKGKVIRVNNGDRRREKDNINTVTVVNF